MVAPWYIDAVQVPNYFEMACRNAEFFMCFTECPSLRRFICFEAPTRKGDFATVFAQMAVSPCEDQRSVIILHGHNHEHCCWTRYAAFWRRVDTSYPPVAVPHHGELMCGNPIGMLGDFRGNIVPLCIHTK
jgi:hypothetical protein